MALAILSSPSTWEVKLAMGGEDMQKLIEQLRLLLLRSELAGEVVKKYCFNTQH